MKQLILQNLVTYLIVGIRLHHLITQTCKLADSILYLHVIILGLVQVSICVAIESDQS